MEQGPFAAAQIPRLEMKVFIQARHVPVKQGNQRIEAQTPQAFPVFDQRPTQRERRPGQARSKNMVGRRDTVERGRLRSPACRSTALARSWRSLLALSRSRTDLRNQDEFSNRLTRFHVAMGLSRFSQGKGLTDQQFELAFVHELKRLLNAGVMDLRHGRDRV